MSWYNTNYKTTWDLMLLALVESSYNTQPRNKRCSHHEPMSSGVRSRSKSYDKSRNIGRSVVFVSYDSSRKYLPYSNRRIERKLKPYTTQVNISIILRQAYAQNSSLLPFLKNHRFSYERKLYILASSVLEIHGSISDLLQLSGSLGIYWLHQQY